MRSDFYSECLYFSRSALSQCSLLKKHNMTWTEPNRSGLWELFIFQRSHFMALCVFFLFFVLSVERQRQRRNKEIQLKHKARCLSRFIFFHFLSGGFSYIWILKQFCDKNPIVKITTQIKSELNWEPWHSAVNKKPSWRCACHAETKEEKKIKKAVKKVAFQ